MSVAEAAEITALEAQLDRERQRRQLLEEQLRNLADHDPVTDLLNRRSIEHELEVHLTRCTRYGPEGAFLLARVDGLDEISSALGQDESDRALAAMAEMVGARLRVTDVAGRWDAGTLAVLLPRANGVEVAVVADSLVRIVHGTSTPCVPPASLAASIGVAPVVAVATEADHLVARAHQALLSVRHMGGGWDVG